MEIYKYIKDKLNNDKIVILDGANGSELEKKGIGFSDREFIII